MATASFTLTDSAAADHVLGLVSQTETGSVYRDTTRSLALPLSLEVNYQVGQPGQKGNNRSKVILRNSIAKEDGTIMTGSVTLELSMPRDGESTLTHSKDVLAMVIDFLSTGGVRDALASAAAV